MKSGQSDPGSDNYLHCLAVLPISFLGEQGDRIAELCNQSAIGDNYRNLFVSSTWVYPMHAYMALVREHMGVAVAEAVWSRQRKMLDEADAGAGESMESAFMLIDEALDMSSFRMEAASQFLPEVRVAMALLLGMPESPDYSGRNEGGHVGPRTTLATVEGCLAHCLLRARVELLAACSELFACNYAKC